MLYDQYRLSASLSILFALVSTIQYFNLSTKLRNMRGTLAYSGMELIPFMTVFFLFYLTYALVAMINFGHSIEEFSDILVSINTCFDMASLRAARPVKQRCPLSRPLLPP